MTTYWLLGRGSRLFDLDEHVPPTSPSDASTALVDDAHDKTATLHNVDVEETKKVRLTDKDFNSPRAEERDLEANSRSSGTAEKQRLDVET